MTRAPPTAARASGLGRNLSYSLGAACIIRQKKMDSSAKRMPIPTTCSSVTGLRLGMPSRVNAVGGTPKYWATHSPMMEASTQGTMAA